jgi:hypothetical protein
MTSPKGAPNLSPAAGVPNEDVDEQGAQIKAPSDEAWEEIVRDHKLTPAQAGTLKWVINQALADIKRYREKLQSDPDRAELVSGITSLAKALAQLREECSRNMELMQHFLPYDALVLIGQSLTFSAMSEALGQNVFPPYHLLRTRDDHVTIASIEEDTRPIRQALGLKHGNVLLRHLIERLHAPLARWLELDRQNEGGRPAELGRRYLIYRLAESAPDIIGKPAPVSKTGTFVDLCTAVLVACGVSETGISSVIPDVVTKLRGDQSDQEAGGGLL